MRFFHMKELLKIFAINMKSPQFKSSRHSFYGLTCYPLVVTLCFNIFSPFSIFRRTAIVSTIIGSSISFYYNLKDELGDLGKKDTTQLGDLVRYRYQQLAMFDGLVMSYREETKRILQQRDLENNPQNQWKKSQ
eukprot:403367233